MSSRTLSVLGVVSAVIALLSFSTAYATVINVPGDQPTVASGIAAASPGDTVLLASNTYQEHDLSISKPITLAGYYVGTPTVTIDGQYAGRVLDIQDADGVVLSDIAFTHGTAEYGGSVRVLDSDITLIRCVLMSSHSTSEGGGLACYDSDVQAANCAFLGNTSDYGSAGAMLDNVTGLFDECTFSGNTANWGGGLSVYHSGSTVTFDGCFFTSNNAEGEDSYGAGAYCYLNAAPTFTGCSFTANLSGYCGGGVCLDSAVDATVENCYFTGNTAVFGAGFYVWMCGAGGFEGCTFESNVADTTGGGGLLELAGGVEVSQCTFLDNESYFGGGLGVYETTGGPVDCTFHGNTAWMGGAIAYADCISGWATGCTIAHNEVQGPMSAGAGVAVAGPFDVALERCIIAYSAAGEAAAAMLGTVSASECDICGNPGGDWTGCLAGQDVSNDNTGEDPLFCNLLAGDLTLCEDSPCLPGNNVPGVLIGAHGAGCDACGPAVEPTSWGAIKARFRPN